MEAFVLGLCGGVFSITRAGEERACEGHKIPSREAQSKSS